MSPSSHSDFSLRCSLAPVNVIVFLRAPKILQCAPELEIEPMAAEAHL